MITENDRRRETFTPGVPVTLADGQAWQFPRPMIAWRFNRRDDVVDPTICTSLGEEFDAAMKAYEESAGDEPRNLYKVVQTAMRVAAAMLLANYRLSDQELSRLLFVTPDEDNMETWGEILDVARGNAPKPSPGGDT
jgi:hypothetical protein